MTSSKLAGHAFLAVARNLFLWSNVMANAMVTILVPHAAWAQTKPKGAVVDTIPDALTFPVGIHSFAFDSEAGVLAATNLTPRKLSLFGPDEFAPGHRPVPRDIDLKAEPLNVVFRPIGDQRLFVVSTDQPGGIVILKTDGTIVRRYRLDYSVARMFGSEQPTKPYVYWVHGDNMVQFDLQQLKIDLHPMLRFQALNIAPDGNSIYTSQTHPRDEMMIVSLSDSKPLLQDDRKVRTVKIDGPLYVNEQQPQFVACGKILYSLDLKDKLAVLDFQAQRSCPELSLIVGFNKNKLKLASSNSFQSISEYAIPEKWLEPVPVPLRQPVSIEPTAFLDAKRGRAIVACPQAILAISLSKLKLPSEPSLAPKGTLPRQMVSGETLKLDLDFSQPAPTTLLLNEAPVGMTLKDQRIEWTPDPDQIGEFAIELVAESGKTKSSTKWRITVTRPIIELTFPGHDLHVSEDATQAVVWGAYDKVKLEFTRLAVIDLKTSKVLEHDFGAEPFTSAIIENNQLFIARKSMRRFGVEQLQLPEFKPVAAFDYDLDPNDASIRSMISSATPITLRCVSGKRLMFLKMRFDLPGMTKCETFANDINEPAGWLTGQTRFGPMLDGVLWEPDFSSPKLLVWPAELFHFPAYNANLQVSNKKYLVPVADHWYPCVTLGSPFPLPNTLTSQDRGGIGYPYTFQLQTDRMTRELVLIATNTVTSKREVPIPLSIDNSANEWNRLFCTQDRYLVVKGKQLISGSLNRWKTQPLPFHIEPKQTEFFLNAKSPTTVKYLAEGATKFRVELYFGHDIPRTKFESDDGVFQLQVPADHQALLVKQVAMSVFNIDRGDRKNTDQLEWNLHTVDQWYKKLFGRDSKGVFPIPITALVTAQHPQEGEFSFVHAFIFEVPKDLILESMNEQFPFAK